MYLNTDEFGNSIDTKSCQINIFFPLDKELNRQNYLSIDVKSQTSNIAENLDKAISFLTKNLNVESKDNEVKIPNLFKEQIKLNFTDINKQSTTYKNFLKLLVRYKAVENTTKFE